MQEKSPIHWSFWAIGALALVWNLLGAGNYLMQMNAGMLANMPQHVQDLVEYRPAWATGAFALSVFGGALGCVLLLMKKRIAQPLFILALIATIVAVFYGLLATAEYTAMELILTVLSPVAIAGFMIWYTRKAKARGWI
jgi:hypothetical protein